MKLLEVLKTDDPFKESNLLNRKEEIERQLAATRRLIKYIEDQVERFYNKQILYYEGDVTSNVIEDGSFTIHLLLPAFSSGEETHTWYVPKKFYSYMPKIRKLLHKYGELRKKQHSLQTKVGLMMATGRWK